VESVTTTMQTSMRVDLLPKLKSVKIDYLWFLFSLIFLIVILRMLNQSVTFLWNTGLANIATL